MPRFWRQALAWGVLAFWLRLGSALLAFGYSGLVGAQGFFPLESGADDFQYFSYAVSISQGTAPVWYPTSYPLLLGTVFMVTGPCIWVGILLSVMAGATCVTVGVLITGEFWNETSEKWNRLLHPGNVAGALLCFYPSAFMWSLFMTRDTLLLLSALLSFYFAVRIVKRPRTCDFVLAGISLVCFFDLRPYSCIGFVGAAIVYWSWVYRFKLLTRPPVLLAAAIAAVLLANFAYSRYSGYLSADALENLRKTYSGGSSIGLTLDYTNPLTFAVSYAANCLYILLSPVPWQVSKPQHAFALIESIPMTFAFPVFVIGMWRTWHRRVYQSGFLLIVAAFQLMLFGLLSDNAGSNARIRMFPYTLLVIYLLLHLKSVLIGVLQPISKGHRKKTPRTDTMTQ